MMQFNMNCDGSICKFQGSVDQNYLMKLHHGNVRVGAAIGGNVIIRSYLGTLGDNNLLCPVSDSAGSSIGLSSHANPRTVWRLHFYGESTKLSMRNYFSIEHVSSGLFLDREQNGNHLILYPRNYQDNQKFDYVNGLIYAKGTLSVISVDYTNHVNMELSRNTESLTVAANLLPGFNTFAIVELLMGKNPGLVPRAIQNLIEKTNILDHDRQEWDIIPR